MEGGRSLFAKKERTFSTRTLYCPATKHTMRMPRILGRETREGKHVLIFLAAAGRKKKRGPYHDAKCNKKEAETSAFGRKNNMDVLELCDVRGAVFSLIMGSCARSLGRCSVIINDPLLAIVTPCKRLFRDDSIGKKIK